MANSARGKRHSDLAGTSGEPVFDYNLLSVSVTGSPAQGRQAEFIPEMKHFPAFLADITEEEVKGSARTITYASHGQPGSGPVFHTIDGKLFDGTVGASVVLSKAEEWKVVNDSYIQISHPFHIHINPFQIVEVFEPNATLPDGKNKYVFQAADKTSPDQCLLDPQKPETWKPCDAGPKANLIWWDVFPIPSGRTVTLADNATVNVPGISRCAAVSWITRACT